MFYRTMTIYVHSIYTVSEICVKTLRLGVQQLVTEAVPSKVYLCDLLYPQRLHPSIFDL